MHEIVNLTENWVFYLKLFVPQQHAHELLNFHSETTRNIKEPTNSAYFVKLNPMYDEYFSSDGANDN